MSDTTDAGKSFLAGIISRYYRIPKIRDGRWR